MRINQFAKGITLEKLQELTKDLPKDTLICCNGVLNFALYDKNKEYIGYIDLLDETIDIF